MVVGEVVSTEESVGQFAELVGEGLFVVLIVGVFQEVKEELCVSCELKGERGMCQEWSEVGSGVFAYVADVALFVFSVLEFSGIVEVIGSVVAQVVERWVLLHVFAGGVEYFRGVGPKRLGFGIQDGFDVRLRVDCSGYFGVPGFEVCIDDAGLEFFFREVFGT